LVIKDTAQFFDAACGSFLVCRETSLVFTALVANAVKDGITGTHNLYFLSFMILLDGFGVPPLVWRFVLDFLSGADGVKRGKARSLPLSRYPLEITDRSQGIRRGSGDELEFRIRGKSCGRVAVGDR
jgi:hypothetical protein